MKRIRHSAPGYTLLELTIVLALIGMVTVALIGSYSNSTKVEAFNGNIRRIVDKLSQAQTSSYSISAATTCSGSDEECFHRGIVHEYNVNNRGNTLTVRDIYGEDMLRMREEGTEFEGIHSKATRESINFDDYNIKLTSILYDGNAAPQASIAFLTPAGTSYTTDDIPSFSGGGAMSPYAEQQTVILEFEDMVTSLEARVTYNAQSGTINTSIN